MQRTAYGRISCLVLRNVKKCIQVNFAYNLYILIVVTVTAVKKILSCSEISLYGYEKIFVTYTLIFNNIIYIIVITLL